MPSKYFPAYQPRPSQPAGAPKDQLNQLLELCQRPIKHLESLDPIDLIRLSAHIDRIGKLILAIEKRDIELQDFDRLENLSNQELKDLAKEARKFVKDLP